MDQIKNSLVSLERWIEEHNYEGYEPFDGLSSYFYPLTCKNLLLERILQQLIRQSPVNLRPLFGVKPLPSTKGRGFIGWGYLRMHELTGEESYRKRAIESLMWLDENKSPFYEKHSWGNHFEYSSRGGRIPKFEPTIVWTGLIGQTFLDGYDQLGNERFLEVAISACEWILSLTRLEGPEGFCIDYTAQDDKSTIHNSNMLGAALLARTASHTGSQEYLDVARQAMIWSCADQMADGAWNYGLDPKYHWIDNFHTGYNLDSLKCYIDNTGDTTFNDNLTRGYDFFKSTFFEDTGRPKYYHNRAYPIDIQCASQAIDTLVYFSEQDETSLELAAKVARWTIENMQDSTGYFWYRLLPRMKVKIPMIHWGQATMYKALANLLLASEKREEHNS